jgi:hypothetical protein
MPPRRFGGLGNDDGTIADGRGSLDRPALSIQALSALRIRIGDLLFREFGFADAFNMTYITPATPEGWYDPDYIGIDQGPIVVMSENLRTGLVWEAMKKNP